MVHAISLHGYRYVLAFNGLPHLRLLSLFLLFSVFLFTFYPSWAKELEFLSDGLFSFGSSCVYKSRSMGLPEIPLLYKIRYQTLPVLEDDTWTSEHQMVLQYFSGIDSRFIDDLSARNLVLRSAHETIAHWTSL